MVSSLFPLSFWGGGGRLVMDNCLMAETIKLSELCRSPLRFTFIICELASQRALSSLR